jgi:hypothetical protein
VLELSADGGVRYYNTFGPNGLLSRWIRNSGGSTSVTRFFLWDERGNLANWLYLRVEPFPLSVFPSSMRGS